MKTILGSVISFILAAVMASCGAFGSERLGSVVALNADKGLVFYDLNSKQGCVILDRNALEDSNIIGVSESAKIVVFVKNYNLFAKFKDLEKPVLLTKTDSKPFDVPQNTKGLQFSPKKETLYFESEAKGKGFVAIPKQSKQGKDLWRRGFDIGEQFPQKDTPIMVEQEDVYTAISMLSIRRYISIGNSVRFLDRANILQELQFGHPAFYPQTNPYVAINGKTGNLRMEHGYSLSGEAMTYYNNFYLDIKNSFQKFGKKRSARYGCFSADDNLFAFIYQTDEGFGPIEIRALSMEETYDTPGIYEIPLSIQNCQGLFWTRGENPSLSILTKKGVYKIDGEKIAAGVKNAKIIKRSSTFGMENLHNSKIPPAPVGNDIAPGKPELVAEGIATQKLYWISENSFVFRDDETGALLVWRQDELIEILKRVPVNYFYCHQPSASLLFSTNQVNGKILRPLSGRERVQEREAASTDFSIGPFKNIEFVSEDEKSARIRIENPSSYSYCKVKGHADLESPEKYPCDKDFPMEDCVKVLMKDLPRELPSSFSLRNPYWTVKIELGDALFLRKKGSGERVAIILAEIDPLLPLSHMKTDHKNDRKFYEAMTVEWKFWPSQQAIDVASKPSTIK